MARGGGAELEPRPHAVRVGRPEGGASGARPQAPPCPRRQRSPHAEAGAEAGGRHGGMAVFVTNDPLALEVEASELVKAS